MDLKSAINIILRDLKEAGDLIEDLGNKPDFPRLQVELAKSKCKSAEELIRLIGEIISDYRPEGNEPLQQELKEARQVQNKQEQREQSETREQPETREQSVKHEPLKQQQPEPKPEKPEQAKREQQPGSQQPQAQKDEATTEIPVKEDPGLFDNDILDLEEDLKEITEPEDKHDETAGADRAKEITEPEDKHDETAGSDRAKESTAGETGHEDSAEHGQAKKSEKIVADRFSHLASRMNEKVGESKKSEGKPRTLPVTDLNRALGINDRFYYIRELFNGNENSFRETIDRLNKAASKEEATSILSERVKDVSDSGPALELLELVERKLSVK